MKNTHTKTDQNLRVRDTIQLSCMIVVDHSSLNVRERTLLRMLQRDLTPQIVRDVLLPLISQTSPVSLRALDWTVVNWSKQHNVVCSSVEGHMINIHHAYRTALSHWRRRLFDPFRRRVRVVVQVDDKTYETTLGQANFVLWAYRTGVLAYTFSHIEVIEEDMNRVSQQQKRKRTDAVARGVRKKRTELTTGPDMVCVAYVAPIKVVFDSGAS